MHYSNGALDLVDFTSIFFLFLFFFFVSVQSCRSTTAVIVNSCTSCITGCCTISDICNYEIIHCHLYKNNWVLIYLCYIQFFVDSGTGWKKISSEGKAERELQGLLIKLCKQDLKSHSTHDLKNLCLTFLQENLGLSRCSSPLVSYRLSISCHWYLLMSAPSPLC